MSEQPEESVPEPAPANPVSLASMKEMCETVPPGESRWVEVVAQDKRGNISVLVAALPDIRLHCASGDCGGIRTFQTHREFVLSQGSYNELSVIFVCRNCRATTKQYIFKFELQGRGPGASVLKLAEHPSFGDPTPARVITLVGRERDYFLKGRRCENQGLGIAAFAYYRRVIENQKNKIFGEIVRVSRRLGADQSLIADLERASAETQFSRAVDEVRHALPQSLLINGHNPLTLLHSALSEGLHAQTDEQCLELATSIRVVLFDFVERVASALKDEVQLNQAVSRLIKKTAPSVGTSGGSSD